MNTAEDDRAFEKKAVEAAIKIGILAVLVIWTFRIIQPFIIPVVWGIIIAVAAEPLIGKFARLLGGRRKLAAALFALVVIAALTPVPFSATCMVAGSVRLPLRRFLLFAAPVSCALRQVNAVWNLFSRYGRRVGVVGYWATWPP